LIALIAEGKTQIALNVAEAADGMKLTVSQTILQNIPD
jgi:hypothetical protein